MRAHVLLTGGVVHGNDDILALLQRALDEAGDDHALRLRVLCHLAENEAVIEAYLGTGLKNKDMVGA